MLCFKKVKKYKKTTLQLMLLSVIFFVLISTVSGCRGADEVKDEVIKEEALDEITGEEENIEEDLEVNQGDLIDEKIKSEFELLAAEPDEFIDLSYEDKEYLMEVAYKAVDNYFKDSAESPDDLFLEEYDDIGRKVFIGFRVNGRKKGSYSARKNNLAESVYIATIRTIEDQRYDGGITEDNLKDLKIEIIILGDGKKFDENYEKGIHGLRIEKGDKSATFYNTVAVEGNYSHELLLEKLCKKAGLKEDCSEDDSVNIFYFPTIHFATTRFSDQVTTFYRCNVVNFNPEMSLEKIRKSLNLAEGWMLLSLDEDGYFNYEYSPSTGDYTKSNNMIRQLMSSRWLAEKSSENDVLLQMHKVNLDYVFRNWYEEDGKFGYIYYKNKSKIGAIAMALRVLIFSPYFEDYKGEAEKLANTILELQNEDGSFRAWYVEPDYSYDESRLLTYYSGQAVLSLVEFYEKTGESKYLDAAIASQDFYINEYVDLMDINYFPAYVPWHTISLYRLYKITGLEKYADAIFKLNDELIRMQNQDGKQYIDYLGRFYDSNHPEYGVPFSGSTAVYVEGLAYAYEIAELENDYDKMYEYKKSIFLGSHNLINLQFKGPDMYYMSHPERVEGAVRYRVEDNRIRVDTTQHTIDAFEKILEIFY